MFSIIITDYNSIERTFNYVTNLNKSMLGERYHVIIVDNSTKHVARSFLKSNGIIFNSMKVEDVFVIKTNIGKQEVLVVEALSNRGYAGGNNLGAKVSERLFNDEYFIFSNNDISFSEKIDLVKFRTFFKEHIDVGIIGPNIVGQDGKRQNPRKKMGAISQLIFWDANIFLLRGKLNRWVWNLDQQATSSCEAGWVSGSFMIVNRKVFDEVKGFDETDFLYSEEIILSEKARRIGYKTYYLVDTKVIHDHRGKLPSRQQRKWNHDARKYYYQKYEHVNRWMILISDLLFKVVDFLYGCKHKDIK